MQLLATCLKNKSSKDKFSWTFLEIANYIRNENTEDT